VERVHSAFADLVLMLDLAVVVELEELKNGTLKRERKYIKNLTWQPRFNLKYSVPLYEKPTISM
jgi:hypothetical protein